MRIPASIGAIALVAILVLTACGSAQPTAGTNINVTLSDKDIALSEVSVPTGTVTFTIANRGTTLHSLVLMRSDVAHDKMPVDPKDPAKVMETGSIAVTGQMAVGATMQITRILEAGQYVLVCNEPAHYLVGMHTGLVVK